MEKKNLILVVDDEEEIRLLLQDFLEKNGYEVYLVGDAVFWNYRFGPISSFDALSCYSAYGGRPQNTEEFGQRLKFLYLVWKIAASVLSKDFIPSVNPSMPFPVPPILPPRLLIGSPNASVREKAIWVKKVS